MTKEVNFFNLREQPCVMDNQPFEVNLVENFTSEHIEEIKLEAECDAELKSEDFSLDKIVNSSIEWASSLSSLNPLPTSLTPSSLESFPSLELKSLPKHLKYA